MSSLFHVDGLSASSFLLFVAKHFSEGILVLPEDRDLTSDAQTLGFFLKEKIPVLTFPAFGPSFDLVRDDPQILFGRLQTQSFLLSENTKPFFLLTTLAAISQRTLLPETYRAACFTLKKRDFIERDKIIHQLRSLGYLREDLAEDAGFFSVRGHLVDFFSPHRPHPVRLEFFGDEIISIREFDPETQRSLTELAAITIEPVRELILSSQNLERARSLLKDLGDSNGISREDRERVLQDLENQNQIIETRWLLPAFAERLTTLLDYLPKRALPLIFLDPENCEREFQRWQDQEKKDFEVLERLAYGPDELFDPLEDFLKRDRHILRSLVGGGGQTYHVETFELLRPRLLQSKSLQPLVPAITELRDKSLLVSIVTRNPKRREILSETIPSHPQIQFVEGPLFEGFASSTFQEAYLNEKDIFGIKRRSTKSANLRADDFLRQFSELQDGDYVIHDDHGLGRYRGLKKLEIDGAETELVLLEYADQDKLYLPVTKLEKITRYVSDGIAKPRLDRLGSKNFSKRKAKIRKDILKVAHELLAVAAQRKLSVVERPSIDQTLYGDFCASFPYDLTPDQESSILDVEADLRKPYPMDRLVCGDVGFGKTEVAMRAAVLRLLQGVQVAVLAPTTLLVEQHAKNFQRRFENFPFRVARLSRFVSAQEQRRILQDLKDGQIDLVIGTHRLLQPDIGFKNLGLLIVDEEQRFGVKHKERIKKWKSTIDVLTLSATPIPRTLQMSIVGIRELSLITTPPENREAVRTYVGLYNEDLIRKACIREKERGGQIFIVHNRVQTIHKLAERIQTLVPECKVLVGHGQMPEQELEEVMLQFLSQKVDILVATSIIESGLDIPNANTLIVDRAELFGLSDLYQLRGRVGRSNVSAYAYILVREETPLTVDASKRLQVLQSCTDLGSGFRVATHDLEIRGSGNLLGEEQSGLISEVGLELYTQMLQDTLMELKDQRPSEPLPELSVGYSAYIPEHHIPDPSVRIATYKRLNRVSNVLELNDLENELLDRFGLPPREFDNLAQATRLKVMAHQLHTSTLDIYPGRMSLGLAPTTPLDPQAIIPLLGKSVTIDPKGRLTFTFESRIKNPSSLKDLRWKTHPEMEDFLLMREFLEKLLSITKGRDAL